MSQTKYNILLIDDDPFFHFEIRRTFQDYFFFFKAMNEKEALSLITEKKFNLILLDLDLEGKGELDSGFNLLKALKLETPDTPIIVVTGDQKSQTVIQAMRLGANDFIRKNELDLAEEKEMFDKYCKKTGSPSPSSIKKTQISTTSKHPFIGESKEVIEIKKLLEVLSHKPNISVLILGESGVGKEVAARYLHEYGARAKFPFISLNLSAIPDTLLESTLFGHKKGAFTGATTDKPGAFERAKKGVVFLDEIGDINHDIQIKLLRVLQEKSVVPIGGKKEIELDVHFISATNKNLEEEIKKGYFREDLYYRLNQFPISIPPLRARKEDLPDLIEYFSEQEEISKADFDEGVLQTLLDYDYPGNIRELYNIIKGIGTRLEVQKVMSGNSIINSSLLPPNLQNIKIIANSSTSSSSISNSNHLNFDDKSVPEQLKIIEDLLTEHKKKGIVAKTLGLKLDHLRYRVEKYHKQYPELFKDLAILKEKYKLEKFL